MDKINQLCIERLKKAGQEGKKEYVFAAIWSLMKEIQEFSQMGFLKSLIYEIALKKINFLMNAKTKSEVKEILRSPAPVYNGNGFVPGGVFLIEEEELLLWSITSLRAPLNHEGFLRYQQLFHKYIRSNFHI